jgi:thiamine-phosphate pyrophosphorylase
VCVLLTEASCARPWADTLRAVIAGGADCIQVREKSLADRHLLARIRAAIEIARPAGAAVIVNDRVDLALAAGADGVHVGQGDLPPDEVRRLSGDRLVVGASTHSLDEARAAVAAGAHVCGVGAMFVSPTKPDVAPSGPAYLRAYLAAFPHVPHLAIGGIDAARAAELAALGCRGVAIAAASCAARDPAAVVHAIRAALDRPASVAAVPAP